MTLTTDLKYVVVILNSPDKWRDWIDTIRSMTAHGEVWELIKPSDDEGFEQGEIPNRDIRDRHPKLKYSPDPNGLLDKPLYPEVSDINSSKSDLGDLTTQEEKTYQQRERIYQTQIREYEDRMKLLRDVQREIQRTVDVKYREWIHGKRNAKEMLISLQARVKPVTENRRQILRDKWEIDRRGSNKKSIDQWLDDLSSTYKQAEALGLEFTEQDRGVIEFLKAIPTGGYRDILISRVIGQKQQNQKVMTFYEAVEEYRQYQNNFMFKPAESAFITLDGKTPTDPDLSGAQKIPTNTSKKQNTKPAKRYPCPCGELHWYEACAYICPSLRSARWKEDPAIKAKFEKLWEEKPKTKAAADRIREADIQKSRESNIAKEPKEKITFTAMIAQQHDEREERDESDDDLSATTIVGRPSTLFDSFILDSGSSIHICNNRERFVSWDSTDLNCHITIGDTRTHAKGTGSVQIIVKEVGTGNPIELELQNVQYVPGFATNIVSVNRAVNNGIYWDIKNGYLEKDGKPICAVERHHELFTIEYNAIDEDSPRVFLTHYGRTYRRQISQCTADVAHQRMGHIDSEAITHLQEATKGVKVMRHTFDDQHIKECEVCRISKAKRQISRVPQERATKAWEKVHFDIIHLSNAYNSSKKLVHFVDDASRWHEVRDMNHLKNDPAAELAEILYSFISYVHIHYKVHILVLQTDGDAALTKDFMETMEINNVNIQQSAPHTQDQNGVPERSGGVITAMARTMIINARLPKNLWPEAYKCSVYLLNRTPKRSLNWRTPFEVINELLGRPGRKPYVGNVRIFGARAYQLIKTIKKSDKMAPRALIGYLVGYEGRNQYWIWNPKTSTVVKARDVTFNEQLRFDPNEPYREDIIVSEIPPESTVIDQPEIWKSSRYDSAFDVDADEDAEAEDEEFSANQGSRKNVKEVPTEGDTFPTPENTPERFVEDTDHNITTRERSVETTTADRTSKARQTSGGDGQETETAQRLASYQTLREGERDVEREVEARERAPRDINADLTGDHVISTSRARRPPNAYGEWKAHMATTQEDADDNEQYYAAFSTAIHHREPAQIHRDDLPLAPANWKEMQRHSQREGFEQAAQKEYSDLWTRGTFRKTTRPTGKQVIPVKWVFTYKFDQEGYLSRFKARLCARGDLQIMSREDTYAATLTARSFRALMAISAIFDLDAFQYDAINAFVNSTLDEEVYIELPDGFKDKENSLRLIKALYGLRRSPRLWQLEFGGWLTTLGLKQIPDDPCVYKSDRFIVIFFVDDIVTLSYAGNREEQRKFEAKLYNKYPIKIMGELKWFLGIRVLRDRPHRRLWICQDSYIDKIVHRFNLEEGKRYPTPLVAGKRMEPNHEDPKQSKIHEYQMKVGSIIYPTYITRPDVAFAASKLAEYLQNPSQTHLDNADRVIKHLDHTRTLAIEYSIDKIDESFIFATDAAYADNADQKSSEGYVFKMFGGVVDWKARKQKTVTTSTTEAELLSLSSGARETYWWMRFFNAIRLDPEQTFEIWCDNAQTVGLLTKIDPELKTKLRHVDIHNHWLRQEIQLKNLHVQWKATSQMPADGLTKALSIQKHQEFVEMLGMRDVQDLILLPNRNNPARYEDSIVI